MLLTTGIGLHHAGIDRKALTTDQAFIHAALQDLLENEAKRFRFAEPAVPILREGRVIRHLVIDTQLAKPSVDVLSAGVFQQNR